MRKLFNFLKEPAVIVGVFFILLILMSGGVSAANPCGDDDTFLGYGKTGETITLSQRCPSCTFVNLTSIKYPNLTSEYFNTEMTKTGVEFNTSFSSTANSGCYSYSVLGNKDGANQQETIDFYINPTGTIQRSIFDNPILIILFVSSLLFLGLGIFFRLPTLGFVGSLLFSLSGVYMMIYGFNDVTNLYTRGVAGTLIGLGIIFMFISAYEWADEGEAEGE